MIIDYSYYSSHGGNKIPQNEFDKYSTIASNIIINEIMNRDYTAYTSVVETTCMAIVDLVYDKEQLKTFEKNKAVGTSTSVASEKVGDYSITYSNYSTNDISNVLLSYDNEIDGIIKDNLFWTGLLNKAIGVIR